MGMGRGTRRVWWWILPRWQARHLRAQAVTSLERPRYTNLDEIIRREASLPGWVTLWKCSKMFVLNLRGTIGRKLPVETSLARRWAPVWRKANLRDVPPSKRCVSGQRFCSVARSSKSTGSAADALWIAGYTPTDRQTSWGVLHHPCTVPVNKLLFIRQ